ncbi:MAG: GNAT family N-acetyltransferase [Candidatus Azobacteroides sp.]|nr:GNAT family N-acetyltransferase [Candidatus Azobacteroides sp.]
MNPEFITLSKENIEKEHICCAFSDKKCQESYELKKEWLRKEFNHGYIFRRLNERAKVFIEYGPAEKAWVPVEAPGYLMINCLWVSGKYKGQGYAKALLESALADAETQGKNGLVTVTGTAKLHFMGDKKWFLKQGFEEVEKLSYGFSLLVKKLNPAAPVPSFKECVLAGKCSCEEGMTVYYSNRCPYTEYHVRETLTETTGKRKIPLRIIKLESAEEAQNSPTPATIFSLFYHGEFITTDISVCMDNRFDKAIQV